jgi:hypothetical protein
VAALAGAAATPEQVSAAQLALARGEVFAAVLETSEGVSEDLHSALVCFDDIAQRIALAQPLRPLITAAEQIKAETEQSDCHIHSAVITVPDAEAALFEAELFTSDAEDAKPVLAVFAGQSSNAIELDVDGADRLIANFEAFLPQLRALRAQLAKGLQI